jgi:hypothetical protein
MPPPVSVPTVEDEQIQLATRLKPTDRSDLGGRQASGLGAGVRRLTREETTHDALRKRK